MREAEKTLRKESNADDSSRVKNANAMELGNITSQYIMWIVLACHIELKLRIFSSLSDFLQVVISIYLCVS
jgi:hypothetical protein